MSTAFIKDTAINSGFNSTTTPLGISGTFTGTAEFNLLPDVAVTCLTDADGTLYVEFSIDGTNWDTSIPYAVTANTGEFHVVVKGPRHCRVRFVNGSVAQTFLRLETLYGTFRQPNSGLSSTIQQDADALTVRNIEPYLMIRLGRFQGFSMDTKFGRNPDVASTGEDIWNGGGTYTGFPTTGSAETVDIFSSDAADTDTSGTGAWTVRLFGLDADYNEQTEDVILDGTNPVTTSNTWWRLNRMQVLTAGSGGANAGTITARHTTTTANVFAVMPIGRNQTAIAAWTVPAGHTAIIKRVHLAGARANAAVIADATLRIRPLGSVFRATRLFTVGNTLVADIDYFGGILMDEKTDVKLRIENASASSGDFVGEFEYIQIKN